eukprot:jgi/Bigna1/137978/aug1.42_g12686
MTRNSRRRVTVFGNTEVSFYLGAPTSRRAFSVTKNNEVADTSDNAQENNEESLPAPTVTQMRIHGINCAIPMIGFGFMDNLVMIQAGDIIDNSIGVTFGLTTLTAAAFGQVCSDVSGVCFGGVIEQFAAKVASGTMGLPQSTLTKQQLSTKRMKIFSTLCAAVGVVIGCFLGMVSLLFMDLDKAERQKKAKRLGGRVFDRYDDDHSNTLNAENLHHAFEKLGWNIDEEDLWRQVRHMRSHGSINSNRNSKNEEDGKENPKESDICFEEFSELIRFILKKNRKIPIRKGGAKHTVLTTGKVVNIRNSFVASSYKRNFQKEGGSTRNFDMYTGYDTFSVLLVPVVVEDPKRVIGLIEFANKSVAGIGYEAFNETDEKAAAAVVRGSPYALRRKQEARLMKQQRKAKREGKRVTTKKCDLCGKDVQLLIRCQIDQLTENVMETIDSHANGILFVENAGRRKKNYRIVSRFYNAFRWIWLRVSVEIDVLTAIPVRLPVLCCIDPSGLCSCFGIRARFMTDFHV